MRKIFAALFVSSIAFMALGAPAQAAPITLGPPLTTSFENTSHCEPACSLVQLSSDFPSVLESSPINGAITSFTVKGASPIPGYAISAVGRSSLTFTGEATSAPQTPSSAGMETFPVAVPIKAGQYISLVIPSGGQIGTNYFSGKAVSLTPPLAPGVTETATEEGTGEAAFSAQVQPAPTVSQINPVSAGTAGGVPVTILGSEFENATSVRFGATPATSFTVNSEDAITAIAPPSAVGVVSVSVTTKAGTAAAGQTFAYQASPAGDPLFGSGTGKKAPTTKCRKGTRRKVVKGKAKCVKAKKHKHQRHHGH